MPRIVFMGTPAFALPSLEALLAAGEQVVGVVTQPDRPVGRRPEPQPPPVKRLAVERGLPVIQPERLREPAARAQLAAWQPDLIVVVAFGQILPPDILALPRFGCLNVHASLLPQLRGAAPVAAAIATGLDTTGVTIMLMDEGLDTGPILAQAVEAIRPDDTTPTLAERLSHLGARLLVETIPRWVEGRIRPQPQDAARASYAPQLRRADGEVDWRRTAAELHRLWRAYQPWPGLYTWWRADAQQPQMLKLLAVHAAEDWRGDLPPGRVFLLDARERGSPPALAVRLSPQVDTLRDGALLSSPCGAGAPRPAPASAGDIAGASTTGGQRPDAKGIKPPGGAVGGRGAVLAVATGGGALILDRVQVAGGRPMDAAAFLRGHPELVGATLGR